MTARILVVDDNPLNQKLLLAKLQHEYYIVSTANDGLEALEKIEAEKPDLILLDVMMPRLDGFETCRRIRENPATEHLPVVIVTALSDTEDRLKGLKAGADDFLTKPINDVALMARVKSLLRLKVSMDEWRLREDLATQVLPEGETGTESEASPDVRTHVLLLEDNPADQKNIIDTLKTLQIETTVVGNIDQTVDLALNGTFSMVYTSLNLRDEDALQVSAQLRAHEETRFLPILLIGQEGDIPRIAKGLDLGANDYLMRPLDQNELIARTRTQLKQKRTYDRLRRNLEQGLSMALVDPLTGVFNRRYLDTRLEKAVQRAQQSSKPISVMMLDIDHFKNINDTYGHDVGDRVLKEVAKTLQVSIRPFDLLARIGGEEFIIVMPDTDLETATGASDRLRKKIESLGIVPADATQKIAVTVSIGCADVRHHQKEKVASVLMRADKALYEAKHSGRNRVVASNG